MQENNCCAFSFLAPKFMKKYQSRPRSGREGPQPSVAAAQLTAYQPPPPHTSLCIPWTPRAQGPRTKQQFWPSGSPSARRLTSHPKTTIRHYLPTYRPTDPGRRGPTGQRDGEEIHGVVWGRPGCRFTPCWLGGGGGGGGPECARTEN